MLPTTPAEYDEAVALYHRCRRNGDTVRKLIDCLIAAVALRVGAEVLHAASDVAVLACQTDLRVHPASVR